MRVVRRRVVAVTGSYWRPGYGGLATTTRAIRLVRTAPGCPPLAPVHFHEGEWLPMGLMNSLWPSNRVTA